MGNIRITPTRHPVFRVITGAEARDEASGALLASAQQIGMEGQILVVQETQYSPAGTEVYKGKVFFSPGGEMLREETIEGSKQWNIFRTWSW